ncbi:MAG: ATP-binding protein, partial [Solirubrobacteraceae bacterium]
CGYTVDYISKLERGGRRPSAPAIGQIAAALELGEQAVRELLDARDRAPGEDPASAPIAGRKPELQAIGRLLTGGGPGTLLFGGEPGFGKTRLLDEATTLAARSGWRVVRGECRPRPGDPYAPLSEAVANSLRSLADREREAALRAASRLDLLLPELRGGDAARPGVVSPATALAPGSSSESERRILFGAVNDYLLAVAGEFGTLLVLDDLQWAGQDALDLLAALGVSGDAPGATIAAAPQLRMIGAYRDTEAGAGSPVGAFVAELTRGSFSHVLGLGPLSETESGELLDGLLSERERPAVQLRDQIVARAGGVPLFLVGYAEELEGQPESEAAPLPLPRSVAQFVGQRLAGVPERAQELVRIAAVAVGPVAPELLCEITGEPVDDVLVALDAACDARLLIDAEDGFRFAHDLVRETIEGDLRTGWRRTWHGRIGAALARLPARRRRGAEAEIAWHLRQSGDAEQAVEWLLRAGDAASNVFGHAAAEGHYRAAAQLARECEDGSAAAQADARLGETLVRMGRYLDAAGAFDRSAAILGDLGERDRRLTSIARSGEALGLSGRAADGIQRILPVLGGLDPEELQASPSAGAADLYATVCGLYLTTGRLGDSLAAADAAVSLGSSAGNLRAACSAEMMRALTLSALGRRSEQRQSHERAVSLAQKLDDPWLLSSALASQGDACIAVGDLAQGESLIRRSLELTERAGLSATGALIRSKLVAPLVKRGRWDEARREAERAERESRPLGPRAGHTYVLAALGRILLLCGDREGGLQRLRDSAAMAGEVAYPPGVANATELLAWQELRDGRPDAALARLQPLAEGRRRAGRPWQSALYAQALLDAGDEQRAAEVLDGARTLIDALDEPPELLLQCARLAAARGRRAEAISDLEAGVAGARAVGLPYDEALLLEQLGRVQRAAGECDQARDCLVRAHAILVSLGAAPDAERLRGELDDPDADAGPLDRLPQS